MALPTVHVYLLAEAELVYHFAVPHSVVLEGVERIADVPAMVALLEEKLGEGTGWEIVKMEQLRLASKLDARFRELRSDVLPALVINPGDDRALRRLVGLAQAIRRIGRKSSGHLMSLAAGLGNRLRAVGEFVVKQKRDPIWLAERLYNLQLHAKKVHKRHYIPFV